MRIVTGHELLLHEPTEAELAAWDDIPISYGSRLNPVVASSSIPSRGIVWAARITGRCPRYRWEREFQHRQSGEYSLIPGLYELRHTDGSSRFLFFAGGDAPVEIGEADIDALLPRAESTKLQFGR